MFRTLFRVAGLAPMTFAAVLALPACGSGSGSSTPAGPTGTGKSGTIGGTVNGSTNVGGVSGAVTGAISPGGAMSGTISGTIGGAAGTVSTKLATPVTFSGSASGTHDSGNVSGTFSGTMSNGGTFSGTFSGPVDPSTRTYTATGNISFSGAVTGTVAVVIGGDCPSSGSDTPDAPGTPAPGTPGTPGSPVTPGTPGAPAVPGDLSGAWMGTYALNGGSAGTMTWSIDAGSGTHTGGTYTGSLSEMPSGAVSFQANPDKSLLMSMTLTCTNGQGIVLFQGVAQRSGAVLTGTFPSLGGGNCADRARSSWSVSLTMTKQ